MTVKFVPNDKGNPPGKLADAELHFSGGPLDGLKLIGAIWERKNGRNVVPADVLVNGERRSLAARPIVGSSQPDKLRDPRGLQRARNRAAAAFEQQTPSLRGIEAFGPR
jgi:hypothetical protein